MSDPLVKWGPLIAAISGWPSTHDEADAKSDCIQDLAAALRAERKRVAELETERDTLNAWVSDLQSGMYVNCVYCGHRYGPRKTTPVSMADVLRAHVESCPKHPVSALKARVVELEPDAANWRKLEAMPMSFRLAHESVSAFPGDDDWDTKRHYEWAVLYQSAFTSNGASPQEALDRAINSSHRWVPDFVLTMWRETIESNKPKDDPC